MALNVAGGIYDIDKIDNPAGGEELIFSGMDTSGGARAFACVQIVDGTGDVRLQGSLDQVTFVNLVMTNISDNTEASSMTAPGVYRANITGLVLVKVSVVSSTGITRVVGTTMA